MTAVVPLKIRIKSYLLTLLHITHPDDDYVRNASRIKKDFTPYLLKRTYVENFPDAEKVNDDYKRALDAPYRDPNSESIDWGFEENKSFLIPEVFFNKIIFLIR